MPARTACFRMDAGYGESAPSIDLAGDGVVVGNAGCLQSEERGLGVLPIALFERSLCRTKDAGFHSWISWTENDGCSTAHCPDRFDPTLDRLALIFDRGAVSWCLGLTRCMRRQCAACLLHAARGVRTLSGENGWSQGVDPIGSPQR